MLRRPKTQIFLLLLGLSFCSIPDARANYWGYSPFTGGSWLWLAQSAFFPFARSGLRYNSFYNGAPYYLANSLVWNASYRATQGLTNRNIARQSELQNYQDPEPIYSPRSRTRPVYPGQFAYDQVSNAGYSNRQQGPFNVPNQYLPPAPENAPEVAPAPVLANAPAAAPPFVPSAAPPLPLSHPLIPSAVPTAIPAGPIANSPFAQGFIDLLNQKYDGNIAKAFKDSGVRSYAQAVGVINSKDTSVDKFSDERIELISKILRDENEDPLSKINAIRLLLKH